MTCRLRPSTDVHSAGPKPPTASGPSSEPLGGHVLPCPDAGKPCEGLRFARPGRRSLLNRSPRPGTPSLWQPHRKLRCTRTPDWTSWSPAGPSRWTGRWLFRGRTSAVSWTRGTFRKTPGDRVERRSGPRITATRECVSRTFAVVQAAPRETPRHGKAPRTEAPRPAGPGPTRLTRRRRRLPLRPWISFLCFCCSPVHPST